MGGRSRMREVPDVGPARRSSACGRELCVRQAVAADIPAIAAIEQAAFADPWPAEAFQAQLARSVVWLAVAEYQLRVVGYVVLITVGDEAEVANIAVSESRRGAGVGAALLDAALHECVARKVVSVYLEVRESNAAAGRLYVSRGFTKVGRRRGYYRNPPEDAIVLRKLLASADVADA